MKVAELRLFGALTLLAVGRSGVPTVVGDSGVPAVGWKVIGDKAETSPRISLGDVA